MMYKRDNKRNGSFINKMTLMKVLYLRIENLENKWSKGSKSWKTVSNQLTILFGERYTRYILEQHKSNENDRNL